VTAGAPIRVGVAGAGHIAQVAHLPAYARLPGIVVGAICDVDVPKARRVAERYGIRRVVSSFEELVALDELDAVDVCLPNHLHAPATVAALESGRHVLCEKPFGRTGAEARSMVEAAEASGKVLLAGFNNRFREDAQVLRRFVAGGALGRVFYSKTGWLMNAASWEQGEWREQRHRAGGGVLLDLGVPMLDLVLWLLDFPEVVSVSAEANPRPQGDTVESTAVGLFRLADGGSISLEVGWGLLMERDLAYANLFGDAGAALLHPLRIHKEMHGSLVNVTPTLLQPQNAYKRSYEFEIQHFAGCIRGEADPASPGRHGLAPHAITEAFYRSALERRETRPA